MYKSPIDITVSDISHKIVKEQENQIYKTVQSVGVNVDKHELIRALNYDRQQYDKGYYDGVKDFAERYKDQIENYTGMFIDEGFYVSLEAMISAIDFVLCQMTGEEVSK